MNKILFGLFLTITFAACGQSNDAVRKALDEVISHAETSSLYRNSVDWEKLRPTVYDLGKDANSIPELVPAFNYLIEALEDDHGRILLNHKPIAYYYPKEIAPHRASTNPEIYSKVQMRQVYKFHGALLKNNIGYLRIVGLQMGDKEKFATEIQSKVCALIEAGAEKWILDLRYNGGGDMFPMVEGITAIIGDGNIGGSKGLTNEENSAWKIQDYDFYYDDQTIALEEACPPKEGGKVAVLTSVYTASSGEAVAVIFKGRENTKFFGQNTFGLVTVTDWTVINDSTAMTIAVSYYKDRNGVVYDKFVDVDVKMPFVEEPLSVGDSCSLAAIKWLEGD